MKSGDTASRSGQTASEDFGIEELASQRDYSGGAEFAFERDLQNYLVKNLESIEPGLKLYDQHGITGVEYPCLLYTSPSPRDRQKSRMPSSA